MRSKYAALQSVPEESLQTEAAMFGIMSSQNFPADAMLDSAVPRSGGSSIAKTQQSKHEAKNLGVVKTS
jgi:hypothetical protein